MVLGTVEVVAVQALWVNLAQAQIAAMEARELKAALQVNASTTVPGEVAVPIIPSAPEIQAQVVWEVVAPVDHMDPKTIRTTNLVVPALLALVVVAVADLLTPALADLVEMEDTALSSSGTSRNFVISTLKGTHVSCCALTRCISFIASPESWWW